jgi:sortase A
LSKSSRGLDRILAIASRACLLLGLTMFGIFVAAQVDQRTAASSAIAAFEESRQLAQSPPPDQTLWSDQRKAHYAESLPARVDAPRALIRIPSIDMTAPVFAGTSELVLNRGVGWIEGTASPGDAGNIGLAGHRDGYFRGLKDVELGDSLEIETLEGIRSYKITELFIVDPSDVYVLEPTREPSVTLVTCYPFYFVGSAPQRYIVRGVLNEAQDG